MIADVQRLTFVAVVAALGAIGLLVWSRRLAARDVLRRRLGKLAEASDPLVRGGDAVRTSSMQQLLIESGLGWTMGQLAARAALAAAAGLLAGTLLRSPLLAAVFGAAGALVLYLIVTGARAHRLRKCDEQMPQALEIMALALRAGHALPSALTLAAQETPAPLRVELERAVDEHALGRPVGEVLDAFGARLPGCEAVNTFVVAVLVLQETGGNLISVIDRIVENARARSSYQSRLRALTAEGRSSAKLLALLPGAFAVLAAVTDPTYAAFLLGDSAGRAVVLVAGGLWLLGIAWTRRLVRALD